ncbi:hypothetical protein WR25_04419 isoform A [Diploscapter pachys]|uniref:Isobutyryl-CoA dehydrogenase, mitochondrial n=2 Tax=Diploscapter pachys TaxID=2018661 RepID=A0A2A2J8W9_9BILA|nr:hypothetical protein WR25_04419 isoform A [Diploscapter pachys]
MATRILLGRLKNCAGSQLLAATRRHGTCGYVLDPSHNLDPELLEIQKVAKDFARQEMYPHMEKWDKEEHLPVDVIRKAGEIGFGAIYCSEKYGGSALTRLHSSVIFEQLAAGCASTAAYISIHNMCCWMIDQYGSEELKAKHLPKLTSCEELSSYCLTEPDSGSDAASLRTTARKQGDYYIVNGSKAFISGAGTSKKYVVMVRHEGQPGAKGIFCLLVEDGMPGFSQGKKESKLGWNSQPTRIITFEDCKVPVSNQIGKDNFGFNIAMAGLNGGRLNIASCSLGAAQQAVDLAIDHLKVRKQFGKTLSEFQWNQFRLAEFAAKVHTSRLIIRDAARHLDEKSPKSASLCALAKLHGTENCFEVSCVKLVLLNSIFEFEFTSF